MVSCAPSHTLLQHQGIPRSVFEGQCNVCDVLCKQGTPKHLISELKSASAASQPYADSTVQMACNSLLSHPCHDFFAFGSPSQSTCHVTPGITSTGNDCIEAFPDQDIQLSKPLWKTTVLMIVNVFHLSHLPFNYCTFVHGNS